MVEQGLKAVVYPELDELGMADFVKKLNEHLSGTFINVNTTGNGANPSGGGTDGEPNPKSDKSDDSSVNDVTKETVKEAIMTARKATANQDPDTTAKEQESVTSKLGAMLGKVGGVATAVGVGAVGVASATVGIVKFLEQASPPLKQVMDLFSTAFNLIWMPIGTIMAVRLMPLLQNVMTKISTWMAEAFKIYDTEGWAGLIQGALDMSVDLLLMLIKEGGPIFFEVIGGVVGRIFWDLLQYTSLGQLISLLFGGWPDFWEVCQAVGDGVAVITGWWENDFKQSDVYKWLEDVWNWFSGLQHDLSAVNISNIYDWLEDMWNWLSDICDALSIDNIRDGISDFTGNVGDAFGKMSSGDVGGGLTDLARDATPIGMLGKAVGWWAEGGVATRPTIAGVGEAGPEAIVPLSQFSSIMTEYNNIAGNVSSGGNVMNFYITGSNSQEIGEEVQRILTKSVGKASSKMLWW